LPCGYHGIIGNDKIRIEYLYGKREGFYQLWYDNGQMHEECTYIDDKEEGLCQSWYNNGRLRGRLISIMVR
jgi:antitoxin component YwqK of YwqJK toxin-antitoxin module